MNGNERESSRAPHASRRTGLMAAKVERSKPLSALAHASGDGRRAVLSFRTGEFLASDPGFEDDPANPILSSEPPTSRLGL